MGDVTRLAVTGVAAILSAVVAVHAYRHQPITQRTFMAPERPALVLGSEGSMSFDPSLTFDFDDVEVAA